MEIQKPKIVNKVWGHEEIIVNLEGKYCGKKLHLKKGFRCSIHNHPKEETFYIESGKVFFELENQKNEMEKIILNVEDIVHIFPNKKHRFSGLENSVIIEISTTDTESERETQSEEIPDFENWKQEVLNNG